MRIKSLHCGGFRRKTERVGEEALLCLGRFSSRRMPTRLITTAHVGKFDVSPYRIAFTRGMIGQLNFCLNREFATRSQQREVFV